MSNERPMNVSRHMCDCCGTHEVSLDSTCHNVACNLYADPVTIYKGWEINEPPKLTVAEMKADAARYRKLQRWMSTNVPEGWAEVERLAGISTHVSFEMMDKMLDELPICNVGLCEVPTT